VMRLGLRAETTSERGSTPWQVGVEPEANPSPGWSNSLKVALPSACGITRSGEEEATRSMVRDFSRSERYLHEADRSVNGPGIRRGRFAAEIQEVQRTPYRVAPRPPGACVARGRRASWQRHP
jgi:hypothetical protein